MPNVLFAQRCVRSCPYCFAGKHMAEPAAGEFISWESLNYLADFLESSGEKKFSILGGEPTLHPEFNAMLVYLLERGFDLNVFTSGIMDNDKLEEAFVFFRDLPPHRLSFVCNLNNPEQTPAPFAEQESVKRFLRHFGSRVMPGFNIYRPDFDLDFLFRTINEFGLRRSLRLGVAHPIPGMKNKHIPLAGMDQIVERLCSFRDRFDRFRVKPVLDCGFPLCRFSDEQLGWLLRATGGHTRFVCAPVIDIGTDLSVWPCFPLSSYHRKSVYDFNSLQEIHKYYQDYHKLVHQEAGGIYEACDECTHREDGFCNGGCIAHLLSRFQDEPPVRLKEILA